MHYYFNVRCLVWDIDRYNIWLRMTNARYICFREVFALTSTILLHAHARSALNSFTRFIHCNYIILS